MDQPSTTLRRLLADARITPVPETERTEPRQTRAVRTLDRILEDHGEEHAQLVISVFAECHNLGLEMVASNFQAVSRVLLAHPDWAERIGTVMDVVDEMDMAAHRRLFARNLRASPAREAMATALYTRLAHRFGTARPQLILPLSGEAE